MGRVQLTVAGAVLALAAAAAPADPARASSFFHQGTELRFEADPYEDNDVTISFDAGTDTYRVRDSGTRSLLTDCVTDPADPRAATCDARPGDRLIIMLGDGDDRYAQSAPRPAVVCGGAGDDTVSGGPMTDVIWGEQGDDRLSGGGGFDVLNGEEVCVQGGATAPPGRDTLDGGAGDDALEGGRGTDTITGGPGDDKLFGFAGDDTLDGGPGRDILSGDDGHDVLHGGDDADALCGGEGPDAELGEGGNDQLGLPLTSTTFSCIDADDDVLDGGPGDDSLEGGPTSGLFAEHTEVPLPGPTDAVNGADRFVGGTGDDQLTYEGRLSAVNVSLDGRANDGADGEQDDVSGDIERIVGGAGDDTLTGGAGNDHLDGAAGADILRGGAGDDTLLGGRGDADADRLDGDDGADTLLGGSGPDVIDGGAGADTVSGEGGDDRLQGAGGNDLLEGGPGLDRLEGGDGDDRLNGAAARLVGADGSDVLRGGPGTDALDGGPGGDDLGGGPGADHIAGGDGDGDIVDYTDARSPVRVTFDGVADDGEAGEHDQVDADVEGFRGGGAQDTVFGHGGSGRLEGGDGEDYLEGGNGPNDLRGGAGGDTIRSRGGGADRVGCGPGLDLAIVDAGDRVGSDCESVALGRQLPRAGRRAVVQPLAGEVELGHPGALRSAPLRDRVAVRLPVRLDATRGQVETVMAGRRGRRVVARFRGGPFALHQAASSGRRLGGARLAPFSRRACSAPAAVGTRRLEVRTRASLRTGGSGGTSVGRGTWVTDERCDGTRFSVISGVLRVRDARTGRSLRLRAGQSHLARRR